MRVQAAPSAPLPLALGLGARPKLNTRMSDQIPDAPTGALLFFKQTPYLLTSGEAFSPTDLCFPELIGSAFHSQQNPPGARTKRGRLSVNVFVPDRPPLTLLQLCVETRPLAAEPYTTLVPGPLTTAFALAQGAVIARANTLGADAQPSPAELPSPLLQTVLGECRRQIEAKLTGAALAVGKATDLRPATPEHLFPFDETAPDQVGFTFLSLAFLSSRKEVSNALTLPVNLKDLGGGNRSKKSTKEVSQALTAISISAYRLHGLNLVAKLWGEGLDALPSSLYAALNDLLIAEFTRLGNCVGQLQGAMRAAKERKGRGNKATTRPYSAEEVLRVYESLPRKSGKTNYDRYQETADILNATYPKAPTCTANTVRRLCTEARKNKAER